MTERRADAASPKGASGVTRMRLQTIGDLAVMSGTTTLRGVNVHYRTTQCRPGTRMPAMILLHQSPLSSRRFARLLPHLADFCIPYALDSPGYGESGSPGSSWSAEEYSRIIVDFAESLEVEQVFVFGRATGAVFAIHAAALEPGLFSGVAVYGLPVYTEAEKTARLKSFAPPFVPDDQGGHLQWIWERIHSEYPWIDARLATSLVADYLDAGPDFATAYRAIWRVDLTTAIRRLREPVLLLGGERDRLLHMFDRARKLMPEATSVLMPDATDFVADQNPSGFAETLREWLTSI